MKKINNLLVVMFFFVTATIFAQIKVNGTVVDETGEPLPGASVVEQGTNKGTATDFDGNFTLTTQSNKGTLVISFVGYANKVVSFQSANVGKIQLIANENALDEIIITGVVDIAKDRQTPVAVSTIKAEEIQEKLGSQEFPEILNTTPSVYATKQGGGFGDARINIRGFDQRNTAVMINGMPVNDMENGWVYWSNWAGLSDVTSAMQVQRGLGSSKLAISSVGGTINVITRSSDKKEGGRIYAGIGNDSRLKTTVSYNTGVLENGLSVSALFGRTAGDGYVDGTKFQGYSYFLAFGYKPNNNNDFQITITGAPQWHHQRSYAPSLENYIKYGSNGEPNRRYNSDWGYRNGEEFSFRRNFYHKPVASLNWDWDLSESSSLSTVLYASVARGGGTGEIGRINGTRQYALPRTSNGLVRVDDIVKWNSGQEVPDFGGGKYNNPFSRSTFDGSYINTGNNGHPKGGKKYGSDNGVTRRASMNSHNWFGLISNFNTKLNENLTLDFGVDLRTYKGIHYRRVDNLLGANGYKDYDNNNFSDGVNITKNYESSFSSILNVFKNVDDEQKIDYHNDGKVNWAGAFTQLEYKNSDISVFVQGAVSNQGFQRIDYFRYLDSDPIQKSDVKNIFGGNIKLGSNWNIDEQHNIFANAGFYSKQPLFDAVFLRYANNINPDLVNEKVFGLELGYGFKHENYNLKVNLYRTSWKDRFFQSSGVFDINNTPDDRDDDERGTANLQGVEQIHMGIEVEASAKFGNLGVNFMGSIGNYEYGSDVVATYFDENNDPIVVNGVEQAKTLYLDNKKVGDSPQTTFRLGLNYKIIDGLKLDVSQFIVRDLYGAIDSDGFTKPTSESLKLPNYSLLDAGISYKYSFQNNSSVGLRFNLNNVLDKTYISESETNNIAKSGDQTWEGINTSNRVFFGWGRTWNLGLTYKF